MTYETIRYAVDQGILTITLNRPDRLNAFNGTMCNELIDAFDRADADDAIGAVVMTGEGRAFCAGADLGGGGSTFDYTRRDGGEVDYDSPEIRDTGGLVSLRIYRSLKPVIAAINGPAVGVGITMTLPMDIRLAADTARIGVVFARRGIVPEATSSWFLPRVVGIAQATEWCMTGRIMAASEALAGGLLRSLHAPDDQLPAAYAIAREIIDNTAPVSVALTRQMLWRSFSQDHPMEAHRLDSRLVFARGRSGDAHEGVSSFLEKRTPVYPDRVSSNMPEVFPWWVEPDYQL